jgi:hypothetical protein
MIFSFSPANSRISRPNCLISNSREDLYGHYSPFKRQRDTRRSAATTATAVAAKATEAADTLMAWLQTQPRAAGGDPSRAAPQPGGLRGRCQHGGGQRPICSRLSASRTGSIQDSRLRGTVGDTFLSRIDLLTSFVYPIAITIGASRVTCPFDP